MPDGRLFIGTRRYSSWSLRGWLAVRMAGLDVEEVVIPLAGGNTPGVLALPSRQVPYLEHGGCTVWESIAVAEYCAEQAPGLWPADTAARAFARTISAEMHAGFRALRIALPMNLGRDERPTPLTPEVEADIARIEHLWSEARRRFGAGGPFLFGAFTLADAMYAPVVTRLLSYAAPVGPEARAYCAAVRAHALVAAWYEAAAREPEAWRFARYEQIP
jgi:glutathione S-transferase